MHAIKWEVCLLTGTVLVAGDTDTEQAPWPPCAQSLDGDRPTRKEGNAVLLVP